MCPWCAGSMIRAQACRSELSGCSQPGRRNCRRPATARAATQPAGSSSSRAVLDPAHPRCSGIRPHAASVPGGATRAAD